MRTDADDDRDRKNLVHAVDQLADLADKIEAEAQHLWSRVREIRREAERVSGYCRSLGLRLQPDPRD